MTDRLNLPGLWPGDTVRDPDGNRYDVAARGIKGGEEYIMLLGPLPHRDTTILMPMSSRDDCGPYTKEHDDG